MTNQEIIEAAARAAFFCNNSIMHDHDDEWKKCDEAWLWRDIATDVVSAITPLIRKTSVELRNDAYLLIQASAHAATIEERERCVSLVKLYHPNSGELIDALRHGTHPELSPSSSLELSQTPPIVSSS